MCARALAASLGVGFAILHFEARPDTLRERVRRRMQRGDDASDADLAVLESQLQHAQPLRDDEREGLLRIDAETPLDEPAAAARWLPRLQELGLQPP